MTTAGQDSRSGLIAPIAAALVLVGGIAVLFVSRGTDDPTPTGTPQIASVDDPDDPLVESTVPFRTSPPLLEPAMTDVVIDPPITDPAVTDPQSTNSTTTSTTLAPDTGGPTAEQLTGALLGIDDIGDGDWTEEVPEFDDFCGTVPDAPVPDARADSRFQEIVADPAGVRQITNTLISFPSPEIAEQAFAAEVDLLVACHATTVDLDGAQYRVQVDNDSFSAEESAEFPCADQSAFVIIQLFNDDATLPYRGQSAVSFRCGRNITVTSLITTVGADDLSDDNYFDAAGLSNIRIGALPGS